MSDSDETDPGLTPDLVKTQIWCRLKQILCTMLLSDDSPDIDMLIKFVADEWPGHAPRSREFAQLISATSRLRREVSNLRSILAIPTRRRSPCKHTHLVVICREQETSATLFDDLKTAYDYHDSAGAQWSEAYLAEILKGPLV